MVDETDIQKLEPGDYLTEDYISQEGERLTEYHRTDQFSYEVVVLERTEGVDTDYREVEREQRTLSPRT